MKEVHIMRVHRAVALTVLAFSLARPAWAAGLDGGIPTLAIMDFDNSPGGRTLPPPRLGATAGQLMIDQLVTSGRFRVVDGHWLRQGPPARNQDAALRTLIENAGAAGVDYLVTGAITRFSTEMKQRHIGGLGIVGAFFRLPFVAGGYERRSTLLDVAVLVQVIDVKSGEIITTASGSGLSTRIGRSVGGIGFTGLGGGSNGSSGSFDAQLAEATQEAVRQAAKGLVGAAPRLTRMPPAAEDAAVVAEAP